jgi:hypothetical protein
LRWQHESKSLQRQHKSKLSYAKILEHCSAPRPAVACLGREKITTMKIFRVAILLFAVAVIASRADDTNLTLTVDGVTYSNVTFGTATPVSVSIRHSKGAATVPLDKLSPALQTRFGYDPTAAEKYRQKVEAQRKQAAEWKAFEADTSGKAMLDGEIVVLKDLEPVELTGWVEAKGNNIDTHGATGHGVRGTILDLGRARRGGDGGLPTPGGKRVLVFDWIAPEPVGDKTKVTAYRINPKLGRNTYALTQTIRFDTWKKMMEAQREQP